MSAGTPVVSVRGGMAALRLKLCDEDRGCPWHTRLAVGLRHFAMRADSASRSDRSPTPRLSAGVATLSPAPPAPAAPTRGTAPRPPPWARLRPPAAWRAELIARTRLSRSVPIHGDKSHGAVGPSDATALLVLHAARDSEGRCWLRVRLPSRPNNATAWVRADRVRLRLTRWRIVVALGARTISVYHDGDLRRRFRVVVGAPGTPTPRGLFSIV